MNADPMVTVHKYIEAFNEGDVKGMAAQCAVPASILDDLPPHAWHGPTASEDWYRDVMEAGTKEGASDYFVTLSDPRHCEIRGECAYVVVPATMKFKVQGNEVVQRDSTFTTALH